MLGWLWSLPRSTLTAPLDGVGLGQSITWALDPEACGKLLPTLIFAANGQAPIQLMPNMLGKALAREAISHQSSVISH